MMPEKLAWTWCGKAIDLGFDARGQGPTVLLLPALSSISTRHEMRPLQERLAHRYSTFSIDWPGFGDQPRPPVDWTPDGCYAFLSFLLTSVVAQPPQSLPPGMRRVMCSSTPPARRRRCRRSS
jgi:hypothetical protein